MLKPQPSLCAVLKHLSPSGAVLPAEIAAAVDHSLPIKRREAAVEALVLWGRLTARNGKDYFIAEGSNGATAKGKAVSFQAKYFFSQDGTRWADLPSVDAGVAARAAKLRAQLSGDPAFQYTTGGSGGEDAGDGGQAEAEGGEAAEGERAAAVTEVQRLRCMIDAITASTAVQPKGSFIADAQNRVVPNRLFGGIEYPDKLESYAHRAGALGGAGAGSLADDVRGCWSVHADSFRGVTVLRSLLFPGYSFFYSAPDVTWGSLYVGDGLLNSDLVFEL